MCVTTMCARSFTPMPSSRSPLDTAFADVDGPVSTRTGSSATTRYADVTRWRPVMIVSIADMPGATSNVLLTVDECSGPLLPNVSVVGATVALEGREHVVTVNVVVLAGTVTTEPVERRLP